AKTIEENCKELGFEARSHVVKAQAEPFLVDPAKFREEKPFTLVTLEPPYIEVSYDKLMSTLAASPALGPDTLVVVEYPIELGSLPLLMGGSLHGFRNKVFGRTVLAVYVCRPTGRDLGIRCKPEEFGPGAIAVAFPAKRAQTEGGASGGSSGGSSGGGGGEQEIPEGWLSEKAIPIAFPAKRAQTASGAGGSGGSSGGGGGDEEIPAGWRS
ncbi:unnamed protein product, partial [Polarella glacialis]